VIQEIVPRPNLSVLLVPAPRNIADTERQHFEPSEHSRMPSLPVTLLCQYHYDALDRLIANTLPNEPEHQRFYCKSRLATEIQGAMRYSIVQHGDQLLAQQQDNGNRCDTTLLVTDQQRSVLQTLKANQAPEPIAYSPYGHHQILNGLLSLLGFNGEQPDPVTGYYLLGNGYRPFNPVLMRFVSPDNWSPLGRGGLNHYAYCLGNPVSLSDPSGHSAASIAAAKILKNTLKRSRPPPKIASGIKKRKVLPRAKNGPDKVFDTQTKTFISYSINDGTTTMYMDSTGIKTYRINSPTLKQLSFSSAKGRDLQKLANSSQASGKLISEIDKSIGDINLDNYINDVHFRNPNSHNLDRTQFHAQNEGYASAMNGEQPGILPTRAANQIIRYGNDTEIRNPALRNRFPHLFEGN
jgi:RHS repeat-associated protein